MSRARRRAEGDPMHARQGTGCAADGTPTVRGRAREARPYHLPRASPGPRRWSGRLDEVAAAQLLWRESGGRRDTIHVALEGKDALRRAEAAKGPMRRNVG